MTANIQELAEQAKKSVPQGILTPDKWIEEYNKKFSELIVKECALVIQKKVGPKSALDVLEHFGVEE